MGALAKSTGSQPFTENEIRVIKMHGREINDIVNKLIDVLVDSPNYDWWLTYYQKRYIIINNIKYDGDGIKSMCLVLGADKYRIFKQWLKEIGRC